MLNLLDTSDTRMIGVLISELLREVALGTGKDPLGEPEQAQAHNEQDAEPPIEVAVVDERISLWRVTTRPQGALESEHNVTHRVGQIDPQQPVVRTGQLCLD